MEVQMKMVKSLLLGSAAGLVAVAGAQAADLPVKAKAVEYVKICSLYGAGFYYVPGTDICLKLGGYVRAQYYYNQGSAPSNGPLTNGTGVQTRTSQNDTVWRARYVATIDTRQQTEYGTVRTYLLIGDSTDGPSTAPSTVTGAGGNTAGNGGQGAIYSNRGFIQFAGFTFGKTQSYFDLYSAPAVSYFGYFSEDTGDGGKMVAAYTAQFGGGFSATISAEDPRRAEILNTNAGGIGIVNAAQLNAAATQNAGVRFPDIVGALRYDQSWGSVQVMGAIHDASGGYYGSGSPLTPAGHPGDTIGWAVGVGGIFQTPFITQGDYFEVETNYSQGAVGYNLAANNGNNGGYFWYKGGQSIGLGLLTDGVYGCTTAAGLGGACVTAGPGGAVINGSSMQLTSVWSVNAAYDHFWTPALRTSLYADYFDIRYNGTAAALIDFGMANPFAFTNGNPNWQAWQIGSRTQWNVTPAFYLGVEVLYTKLQTGFNGLGSTLTTAPQPGCAGLCRVAIEDQNTFSFTFRAHRDFLP
jgi:hypothetical protein